MSEQFAKWHFRPDTQDEFIVNEVYVSNCYRLPDDLSGKVVVDIGANVGAFTIACLDRGAEHVYAYEPDHGNFCALREHVQSHSRGSNVSLYNAFVVRGLGGKLPVPSDYENCDGVFLTGAVSHFGTYERYKNAEKLDMVDAISASEIQLVNGCIWVKLDCEGSEYEILLSDLPWDRIERVFGECHDLIDGRLSQNTAPVYINLGEVEISRRTIQSRLESVGYSVEIVPHEEDPHLSLFFAEKIDAKYKRVIEEAKENVALREKLIAENNLPEWSVLEGRPVDYNVIKPERNTVCVLTPFRNARKYLPLYFSQLSALRDELASKSMSLRLVAAEGDSLDGTRERIVELSAEHDISLTVVDTTHGHMRWGSVEDPLRMRAMSDVMNKALSEVRESDDIVVWIMSDLKWDACHLVDMIHAAKDRKWNYDIFAPMTFTGQKDSNGHNVFYDTWAYRRFEKRFTPEYPYNRTFSGSGVLVLSEVDSAGTCLAMRGDIARSCRASDLEAVSFCADAKSKGHRIAMGRDWEMFHAPVPSKRLLWISDAVCTSGFSRVAHAMFPILAEAGYDIDIVARNYWGTPHNFPYRIWPANVNGDYAGGELRAKLLISGMSRMGTPYDVVVTLDDVWNVPAVVNEINDLRDKHGLESVPPVVAWVMVDGKNAKGEDLNSVSGVISPTDFGTRELVSGGIETNNVWTVPFGVDTSIFRPLDRAESRSLVSSKDVPEDAFIVGVVANNQFRKRLDLHVEYFASWVKQYRVDNAYLYIRAGSSNEQGCDVLSLIKYYGLQKRVILPYDYPNCTPIADETMALIYNAFDVYLSIPLGEGFGLTALEAMACGVPCVVSDWSGYGSWIPDDCALKIPCTSTMLSGPLNAYSYVIGGVADKGRTVGALAKLYTFGEVREKLREKGLTLARSLTWKETGKGLLKALDLTLARVRSEDVPNEQRTGSN